VSSQQFIGRYFHSIDEKGRVAIPHVFRTLLGGENENRVVITQAATDTYTYLDLYPAAQWDSRVKRILDMELDGDDAADVREAWLANVVHPAQTVEPDKQGRVLVPQEHREFARLDKEVVWTGDGQRFRLWARAEYERYNRDKTTPDERNRIKRLKGVWL